MTRKKPKKRPESEERPDASSPAEVKKEEAKLESDELTRADDEGMPPADDEAKPG
jgi:hypothetical protein